MNAPDDTRPYPPLPVWKLALLLIATATLYQFAWLYRTAEDLRKLRDPSIQPWHWIFIPLLGPAVFIPGSKLASYLKVWQTAEKKEIAHLADPVMVGMMMFTAYLPLLLVIVDPLAWTWAIMLSWLLLCLAYLPLQGQMNFNKKPTEETAFRSTPWRYEKHQVWGGLAGLLVAVPLYVSLFTDTRENWVATDLGPQALIQSESGLFQVRIMDEGWSRVGAQFQNADAELSFYGPDDRTSAVVYDFRGLSVDDVMAFRVSNVLESFSRATCTQQKTLDENNWVVIGTVVCDGHSPIDGSYIFASRVLRDEENVIEILAYTSGGSRMQFDSNSTRVQEFIGGLELIQ